MDRALIFDCDGVLADTEPDGHLIAFNQMWEKLGVPWRWSKQQYGDKLKIGGGKERMASLFRDPDFCARVDLPASDEQRKALITEWHKEKTILYEEIISSGKIPPRPGVKRLSEAALKAGWALAVASTSAPSAVSAVLKHVVGGIASEFMVLAGDVVQAKKPAPDIYELAVRRLGIAPQQCVAIEDSRNGLVAARAASVPVVVTISEYTASEDMSDACLVVDSLGDPGGLKCTVLANRTGRPIGDFVTLDDLEGVMMPSLELPRWSEIRDGDSS
jgi:HAD superfamily hydrolase (TIGR01509 family)